MTDYLPVFVAFIFCFLYCAEFLMPFKERKTWLQSLWGFMCLMMIGFSIAEGATLTTYSTITSANVPIMNMTTTQSSQPLYNNLEIVFIWFDFALAGMFLIDSIRGVKALLERVG